MSSSLLSRLARQIVEGRGTFNRRPPKLPEPIPPPQPTEVRVGTLTIVADRVILQVTSLEQSVNVSLSPTLAPVVNVAATELRPTFDFKPTIQVQPANVTITVPPADPTPVNVAAPSVTLPEMQPVFNMPPTQVTVQAADVQVNVPEIQPVFQPRFDPVFNPTFNVAAPDVRVDVAAPAVTVAGAVVNLPEMQPVINLPPMAVEVAGANVNLPPMTVEIAGAVVNLPQLQPTFEFAPNVNVQAAVVNLPEMHPIINVSGPVLPEMRPVFEVPVPITNVTVQAPEQVFAPVFSPQVLLPDAPAPVVHVAAPDVTVSPLITLPELQPTIQVNAPAPVEQRPPKRTLTVRENVDGSSTITEE